MANIEVERSGPDEYTVAVVDEHSSSRHVVTAVETTAERHGVPGHELVAASFRFLLDREPKESILSRFDLGVIGTYFPEFSTRIGDYLRG